MAATAPILVNLAPSAVELVSDDTFPYIPHLQNRHRSEVGFLPNVALRQYQHRQQLWIARENGEPCGYLAWGGYRGAWPKRDPHTIKIIQACIQYDAQQRTHGTGLVHQLETMATLAGIDSVSLWCADDLPANEFWKALGYHVDGHRIGGSAFLKDRRHLHWIKYLDTILQQHPKLAPMPTVLRDLTPRRSIRL